MISIKKKSYMGNENNKKKPPACLVFSPRQEMIDERGDHSASVQGLSSPPIVLL